MTISNQFQGQLKHNLKLSAKHLDFIFTLHLQVMVEHRSENLLRVPILTYSRQQLMDLRRQRCLPSSIAITILKQCGIFKFRGQRGGRYRRIQRHYANFSVCPRPLFHRAVNPDNLAPIKKAPLQASTPTSQFH